MYHCTFLCFPSVSSVSSVVEILEAIPKLPDPERARKRKAAHELIERERAGRLRQRSLTSRVRIVLIGVRLAGRST